MAPTSLPLLPLETSIALMEEESIATVTFFRGPLPPARSYLKERFSQLVHANPWLAGELQRPEGSRAIELWLPETPGAPATLEYLMHTGPLVLGSSMSYEALAEACATVLPCKGRLALRRSEPLCRLAVVADADDPSQWALVFALSHVLADGATYYALLNALSDTAPLTQLDPHRRMDAAADMEAAVGTQETRYLSSAPMIANAVKGMVRGSAQALAYRVDPAQITAAKQRAVHDGRVPFVSTNDVLTSSFARALSARLCMMAINFRGKLPGITHHLAGNYESGLLLDEPVYGSPAGIRAMLHAGAPYASHTEPFPGVLGGLTSDFGQISNWATFAQPLSIPGSLQQLHLPLYRPQAVPLDCAVIFQPRADELAVLYLTHKLTAEAIEATCEVAGPMEGPLFSARHASP